MFNRLINKIKDKFMNEAKRSKLSGYQWYTDGITDIRVKPENVETFLINNPTYRRGRLATAFKKKEAPMEQKPFDYEQELNEQGLAPNWVEPENGNIVFKPGPMHVMGTGSLDQFLKLHLVEGTVQLRRNQPGDGMIQSEQRRIVWAQNGTEAVRKFSEYFASLNTPTETYNVVFANVSEEIR